ncbi:MAG TPA: pseudouridine synthase [Patescibacteria group bacterium]|nr:pseudouridine synthase [Patescibacteria group bacterium]
MPEERLQKVIAASGLASRRAAEALIAAGRVRVDGRRATIGQVVDPAKAKVEVDGLPIGDAARTTYLLLHKPAGVTSTTQDRHAESTVLDFVPTALVPDGARLYPVGRLDQDSEGLLILTNDGGWSEKVLHPRFGVEREYALAVRAPLSYDQVHLLEDGIPLEEGLATLHHLREMTAIEIERLEELLDPPAGEGLTWYRVTLRQGWKRQLRRVFGAIEAPIERLIRVRIGPVRIDGLGSGKIRRLKAPEVRGLAGGGGRSRGDDRPGADDAADPRETGQAGSASGTTPTRAAGRPSVRGRGSPRPTTDRTRSAAAARKSVGTRPVGDRQKRKPGRPDVG